MKTAISIDKSNYLPQAAYAVLFENKTVVYKGAVLKSAIVRNDANRLVRAVEVGNFLYVAQPNLGLDTRYARMARKGHKILWILEKSTRKLVGKVVDGKVTQL